MASLDNLIIRASAGTGKTYQLSNRYLALLMAGVRVDHILATTFTRKAAGEIRDRVIVRLARAVADDRQRDQLAAALRVSELTRETCLQLTNSVLRNLHRLRICTLDSHFAQLARGLSLELGLPPHWRIIDEWENEFLRDRALDAVLRDESTAELHTLTNLLTKGETTYGIADLLRNTVRALHGLYQDTEEAAWKGLLHAPTLDAVALDDAIETLRTADLKGGLERSRDGDLRAATEGDWDAFIKKGIPSKLIAGETLYNRAEIRAETISVYQPLIDHARGVLTNRVAQQTEASFRLLHHFDAAYRAEQRQHGGLRFQDVTYSLAPLDSLSRADSPTTRLAFRLDGDIEHVLLDEFQDTAPAQWRAIRRLAEEVTASPGGTGSFFCVGDVKQAIYAWRGGVAEIFEWVESHLAGLRTEALDCSYRSSPAVIEAVNRVFLNICRHSNLDRYETAVRAWCSRFPAHQTARETMPGLVRLETARRAEDGPTQELERLALAVERVTQVREQLPHASIGILVRKNETVGKLIYLLRDSGIPASEEGGNPLTDSAAVELVLSCLRLVDHPGDSIAWYHLANSPLGSALRFPETSPAQVASRWRRQLSDEGYPPLIESLAAHLLPRLGRRERNRLQQLIEQAYLYQPHATARTDDFRRFVNQQRISDPSTASVRVMTVHQAKGLEFDVVVLPELDGEIVGQPGPFVVVRDSPAEPVNRICRYVNVDLQRLLPARYQAMFEDQNQRSVAESLCVLYVALTRAVYGLYMIIAPSAPRERELPKKLSGLLRAALTNGDPAEPAEVLYEHGQADWIQRLQSEAARRPQAAQPSAEAAAAPISLRPTERTQRSFEFVSPSHLEGGPRLRAADALAPQQSEAMARGTLVHAFCEEIEWLDDGLPERGALARLIDQTASPTMLEPVEIEPLLDEFERMMAGPKIRAILSRKFYEDTRAWGLESGKVTTEVLREHPFAIFLEGRLLTGVIDRLVLMSRGQRLLAADVLDFKTDRLDRGGLDEKVTFYRPQLEAYRHAVEIMTGIAPSQIQAHLLFLATGDVVSLE